MTKDEVMDKLWEQSNHGTRREDVEAAYNAGARAATNECADILSINRNEAQLMAGEMTASEWRTVAAVLKALQTHMRSNAKLPSA